MFDIEMEREFCSKLGKDSQILQLTQRYLKEVVIPPYALEYSTVLVQSFFATILLKNKLSPVLNKVIPDLISFVKKHFPEEMAQNTAFLQKQFKQLKCLSLDTIVDISAVFTIHMDCMKELYWGKPKKIAFLLEGNQFISQRIQVTARKYLGSYQKLFFPNVLDINPGYFEANQFDIIVTNYNEHMSNFSCSGVYLLFNKIPNSTDWRRLMSLIDFKL